MSESDSDVEEQTNHLSIGHLTSQKISDLCLATRAVHDAFNEKSREGLSRAVNGLNRTWMDVTSAPVHVVRSMESRLSLPVDSGTGGNKRKAGNSNSNGDDSRKRAAGGGEEETKDAEEAEEADAEEGDDTDIDVLLTVRSTRTKLLALRSDNGYTSDYAIGRLPSVMGMSESNIEFIFEDESDEERVDEDVMLVIDGILSVFELGMEKALLFRPPSSERAWNQIEYSTIGSLAANLDESVGREIIDSADYSNVKKAIEFAVNSGDFQLPSNRGIGYLAKHFLTVNEATRNHLLVLVHFSAGCSAFLKVNVSDLLDGKSPVLSPSVLETLGYDDDEPPADTNQLLRRFKSKFDDESINLDNKVELHE